MDFNTQRRIVKNISNFAERHKLLLLPCLIATGLVALFFKIGRCIDIMLSDKDGNFLGIERKQREIKPRPVIAKRPLATRLLCGVLAIIFVVSFTPGIDTFAAWVKPAGSEFYYDDTQTPAAPTINSLTAIIGYGAIKISWNSIAGADGYAVFVNGSTTPYTSVTTTSAIVYGLSATANSRICVKAYKSVDLFGEDPANPGTYNQPTTEKITLYSPASADFVHTAGQMLPTYPTVTVTRHGERQADIEWSQVADADGYVIYRKNSDATSPSYSFIKSFTNAELPAPDSDGNISYFNQDYLDYGTKYDYAVIAYRDIFGLHGGFYVPASSRDYIHSASSPETCVSASVDFIVTDPDKPSNFKAVASGTSINLTWAKNSNADGYYIYRSETPIEELNLGTLRANALNNRLDSLGTSTLAYVDSEADNGTKYYYYVSAYRSVDGLFFEGFAATVSTQLNTTVSTPVNIIATPGDGKVDLKWDPCTNAQGYEVIITKKSSYDGNNAGLPSTLPSIDNGNKTTYSHIGLFNGDVYDYLIRAYTIINGTKIYNDTPALPVTVTVGVNLSVPQDVAATTGEGYNEISWSKVTGATSYRLYGTRVGGAQTLETTVTGEKFKHTGLVVGEEWTYYVRACKTVNNVDVYSANSLSVSVVVGMFIDAPKDLAASTKTQGQLTISWTASTGAQGYYLYASKAGIAPTRLDVTKVTYDHTGLRVGENWTYYVVAYKYVNGHQVLSSPSISVTATVGEGLTAPKDLTGASGDGQIDLTWSKSNNADGYEVFTTGGYNGYSQIADVTKTSATHFNLTNNMSYTYVVRAYKWVNGVKTYSDYSFPVTLKAGGSIASPTDVYVKSGDGSLTISWSKVTGAEGYVLYMKNLDTGAFEAITIVSKTTYTHERLTNGKKYTYMVVAYKTVNGTTEYSPNSMSATGVPNGKNGGGTNTGGTSQNLGEGGVYLDVIGTTPYGISHADYITAEAVYSAFTDPVDVRITTNTESTEAVKACLRGYAKGLSSFYIFPFDISVYLEGTHDDAEINPGYTVTMTVPVPDKWLQYKDYINVVHISDEDSLEVLPSTVVQIDDIWCMKFVCTDFSPYAFVIYKDSIENISSGNSVAADGTPAGAADVQQTSSGFNMPFIMPDSKKYGQTLKKIYRVKCVIRKSVNS